ncbi:hypothetical protein HYX02_05530 [Candidatus Woesearchaeota archaeon]|nr:hypothetical protein [Candidatus Woesearchaeota archaeon]
MLKKTLLILLALLIFGCVQAKNFDYGIEQVNVLNSKYNTSMETYPKTIEQVNSMLNDYNELKNLQLESGKEPFNYVVDYRILNLEAEKLFMEDDKYGSTGSTREGFGCKSRPLIIGSVQLRNKSALKGFETVELVRDFVEKYPEEAKTAGLSEKNALFLNATFYEISREARRDSNIINQFCPANVTLELYQEEFRKKTNLSKDFIDNLTYEDAVPIWKEIRGIS